MATNSSSLDGKSLFELTKELGKLGATFPEWEDLARSLGEDEGGVFGLILASIMAKENGLHPVEGARLFKEGQLHRQEKE